MSKRKSSSQSVQVKSNDMVFEDDDDIDEQTESVAGDSVKGGSGSRVSVRAKKAKAIYDPSEYNGPVHKRKKEALEAEKLKSPAKSAKPSLDVLQKSPIFSPAKVSINIQATTSETPIKAKIPPRLSIPKSKAVIEASKRSNNKKPISPNNIVEKPTELPTVAISKEPSKRIQARKQLKTPSSDGIKLTKNKRESSISTVRSSDEYDRASTIEFRNAEIPDVRKWTHQQVSEYFSTNLGFSPRDSEVFSHEEIDGEAMMIMKRSDIVTTKFQKLKLGTALKMWSHILMFQTGSNDPTQAWK